MMFAPYRNKEYDEYFEKIIEMVNKRRKNNDDTFIFCTGLTGSGKTNLMLHAYDLYDFENASMDFIALKRENFADAMKRAKDYKGKRFVGYDEANISKRDSLTKWNKDIIDLQFAIRGLNIFQWHNNPSVDMLDKALVQEKINGLVFVATKSTDKPRLYYYFTKENVLDMLDKYERITIDILKDKGRRHCSYVGWFKEYKGKLLEEYLAIKENRMESKIDDFHEKWGSKDGSINYLSITDVSKETLVSVSTIRKVLDKLIVNEDYVISPAGYKLFKPQALDKIKEIVKDKYKENVKQIVKIGKGRPRFKEVIEPATPYIQNVGGV